MIHAKVRKNTLEAVAAKIIVVNEGEIRRAEN